MTLNKLAKEISLHEGLKKQVNIAQIKEILGVVSDLFYENYLDEDAQNINLILIANGLKRSKRKKK